MANWLVPPQIYNRETAILDIGRGYIQYAIRNQQILVFRLLKDETKSTGYKLDYRLAFEEPYLAISHSWSDRTGRGDSIEIHDLAPWPITISPAKRCLLDWLYQIQCQGEPWTSWYWMDLFCIDQTRADEHLFSQQLEQIPSVFFRAKQCLALLASWPCQRATQYWKEKELAVETREDEHWDGMVKWLSDHSNNCSCSPTLDAWLTRVWTRQEVMYSKALTMVPANMWLSGSLETFRRLWNSVPEAYIAPPGDGGIRELGSMLVTWGAKYGDTLSSSRIAQATRLLLCGQKAEFSQLAAGCDVKTQHEVPANWYAFNWTMIVENSIRFTTHIRDAILSQMLLLPGYRVPREPWSMPLQELMADSCIQYLRVLRRWQIVPMVTEKKILQGGKTVLLPKLSNSLRGASLCEILSSVGSPCTIPACFYGLNLASGSGNESSLIAYQIEDQPRYRAVCALDLEERPQEAAEFSLSLQKVWLDAEDSRTAWNVRACLEDIRRRKTQQSNMNNTSLKAALRHFIGRLIHTSPFTLPRINRRGDTEVRYDGSELEQIEIPKVFGLEITHLGADIPTYASLAFGELAVGEEGIVWGLGQDQASKFEFGSIMEADEVGALRIRASGVLLTRAGRDMKRISAMEANFAFGHIIP